jgi:hypothetical protein
MASFACRWCVALGLGLGAASCLAGAEDPLSSARSAVEQWVLTRQLTSQTRADWERDRELLQQTRALYQRELATIDDRFSRISTNNTQVDRDLATVRAETATAEASLTRMREVVTRLEEQARRLEPVLPQPLRQQVETLIQRLPGAGGAPAKSTVGERLQTVVALLNEVDKFNASVTVVSEVQKNPEGAEVQVETVYLGLAQAWFVDKAGLHAGVGVPGKAGWEWQARPEIAGEVRRAIACYRETAAPAFVPLPFQLR